MGRASLVSGDGHGLAVLLGVMFDTVLFGVYALVLRSGEASPVNGPEQCGWLLLECTWVAVG